MGFPKEYSGINRIFDSTDHDVQEMKKALIADSKRSGQKETQSLVSLYLSQ